MTEKPQKRGQNRVSKFPKPFRRPTPEEVGLEYRRGAGGVVRPPFGRDYLGRFYVDESDPRIESWEVGQDGVLRVQLVGGSTVEVQP